MDVDPDLAGGIDAASTAELRHALTVQELRPDPGPWDPGDAPVRTFAAIVVRGLLIREIAVGTRTSAHVFGPGDIVEPWFEPARSSLPNACRWTAGEGLALGALGERWRAAAARWPELGERLHRRIAGQSMRIAAQHAVTQLAQVEERVLGILWSFADEWGTVGPNGVTVELPLTHEMLGRLVGAERSTITLGIGALERSGDLARRHGSWILNTESAGRLVARPS